MTTVSQSLTATLRKTGDSSRWSVLCYGVEGNEKTKRFDIEGDDNREDNTADGKLASFRYTRCEDNRLPQREYWRAEKAPAPPSRPVR